MKERMPDISTNPSVIEEVSKQTDCENGYEGVYPNPDTDLIHRLQQAHIDNIWRRLGTLGKFQVTQLVMSLSCVFSISWHILSIIFIGYDPEQQCSRPENDSVDMDMEQSIHSVVTTEYSACQISTFQNGTVVLQTGCIHGYNYSVREEMTFVSEWNIVCQTSFLSGLSQSFLLLGQGFGAAVGPLADKIGRRPVYVYSHAIFFGVLLGTAFVQKYWAFLLFRFITGILQQIVGLGCWIICIELLPNESRAVLSFIGGIVWSFSLFLLVPVTYLLRDESWRTLQIVMSMPALLFILPLFFTKESLRWLIVTERFEEALKLLRAACHTNKVSIESVLRIEDTQDATQLLSFDNTTKSFEPNSEDTSNNIQIIYVTKNGLTENEKKDKSSSILNDETPISGKKKKVPTATLR